MLFFKNINNDFYNESIADLDNSLDIKNVRMRKIQ